MILAFRRPALLALSLSCSISLFLSQYLSIHLSALAHFFRGRGRLPNSTARRLPYFHRTLNPFNADQQVFPRAEICKFIRYGYPADIYRMYLQRKHRDLVSYFQFLVTRRSFQHTHYCKHNTCISSL